jgi:hypothetical protein
MTALLVLLNAIQCLQIIFGTQKIVDTASNALTLWFLTTITQNALFGQVAQITKKLQSGIRVRTVQSAKSALLNSNDAKITNTCAAEPNVSPYSKLMLAITSTSQITNVKSVTNLWFLASQILQFVLMLKNALTQEIRLMNAVLAAHAQSILIQMPIKLPASLMTVQITLHISSLMENVMSALKDRT